MRFVSLFFILLLVMSTTAQAPADIIDTDSIENDLKEQLDLGPRIPGSTGSQAFGLWLDNKITNPWQLTVQTFEYKDTTLKNYLITNSESESLIPKYLIGAHYDTRAVADQDPLPENRDKPVPGASDAASGVAGILEMMRLLNEEAYASDIGFVLFDAEDQGSGGLPNWSWIVGSEYFANSLTQEQVDYMEAFILFDMIGDDDLNLKIEGYSDTDLVGEIWGMASYLGYEDIFLNEGGYRLIDDHRPFIDRGIPSVDIIDFDYPEWHTINDDLEHVSANSIGIVVEVVYQWLEGRLDDGIITSLNVTSNFIGLVFTLMLIPMFYRFSKDNS